MAREGRLLSQHSFQGGDIRHERSSGFQIDTPVKGTKDWQDYH